LFSSRKTSTWYPEAPLTCCHEKSTRPCEVPTWKPGGASAVHRSIGSAATDAAAAEGPPAVNELFSESAHAPKMLHREAIATDLHAVLITPRFGIFVYPEADLRLQSLARDSLDLSNFLANSR
jgi:hypothetical protein